MKSVSPAENRFEDIIREYGRFLRQTILRVCPRDIGLQYDEIEQEARLRLWRALESEREIHDLSSYLYRIAVTATLDAVRKVRRKREEQILSESEDAGDATLTPHQLKTNPGLSPDRQAERQQIVSKVREAMANLPENRRTAVGLHLEGMTTQEIADLLGWSEPKARNLVYRGLSDVRQFLKEAGIEYATQ